MRVACFVVVWMLGCTPPGVSIERVPVNGEGEGERSEGEGEGEGEGEPATMPWSHPRQLRGAWLATVFGIDWPTDVNATATAKQDELMTMIDNLGSVGVNAVMLQVRPESDALYASSLEPWSRFLTGRQGEDPGFDPLAVAIEQAHRRGMELHAWFNPYRGLTSTSVVTDPLHITNTWPSQALPSGNGLWMNPSSPEVRAHVVAVIVDVLSRYDVDGVVFDDYFYPYPNGTELPDDDFYQLYLNDGGMLSKGDWRRDQVNALIVDVASAIAATSPAVRFMVSPFGINGLDAYEDISCDAVRWLQEDWVDALLPQLYWPSSQAPQAFGTLVPWWSGLTDDDGRLIMPAINWANYDSSAAWSTAEFVLQWQLSSTTTGSAGVVGYHAASLLDADALSGAFSSLWSTDALPPENPRWRDAEAVPTPLINANATDDGWRVDITNTTQRHVVYLDAGAGPVVVEVVPAGFTSISLNGAGSFGITAVDAANRESLARVINP
jgi:uncharacterized lipoprotein YddW (UPF0748 family)